MRRMSRAPLPALLVLAACGGAPAPADTAASTSTPASTTTATTATTAPVPGDSSDATPTGSGGASLGGTGTTDATSTGPVLTTTASSSTSSTDSATTDSTTTDSTTTDSTTDSTTADPPLLTLEHAQFKGTHNSYHQKPLIPFDPSHNYSHVPLAEQLADQGVRAFELDVHEGLNGFEVYHITVIDAVTSCDTLPGCLGAIEMWSVTHPQHLPVVVWIELKDSTGGTPIDAADLDKLDDTIRGVFAEPHLFTPDDLKGGHASVRDALADGWPALDSMRGQVLVVLLNVDDPRAGAYTAGFTHLDGRAMFVRATPEQFDMPWTAIAKLGADDDAAIAAAHAAHMLIATNTCGAGEADDVCFASLAAAEAAGIHMLKDDFPAEVDGKAYWLDLMDGTPARCNPVTAPPGCTSLALEDL